MADIVGRVFYPLAHPRTTAVTIMFAGFLLLAYVTMLALATVRDGHEPNRRNRAAA